MKTYHTMLACALCAAPALVQPVSAEEEEISRAEATMVELIEVSTTYIGTLGELINEETTIEKALVAIAEHTEKAQAIIDTMKAFPEEDMKDLEELMQIPEVIQSMQEFEEAAQEVTDLIIEAEYLGSPELKAACEKFEQVGM